MSTENTNPAVKIFGDRFYNDQSSLEFIHEFLLLCASPKKYGDDADPMTTALPSYEALNMHMHETLLYAPRCRIDLKLFALLGSSRLSTRVPSHIDHLYDIRRQLKQHLITDQEEDKDDILNVFRDVFLGFQGCGKGRTWCAQTMFPLCGTILSGESIWNTSKAKNRLLFWDDIIEKKNVYFSLNKHKFLARGGECLYNQILLSLSKSKSEILDIAACVDLRIEERDPQKLHATLEDGLHHVLRFRPFDDLASFIQCDDNNETAQRLDFDDNGERHFVETKPIVGNSWKIGYLLAVEMTRILALQLNPIEKITQLEMLIDLHILRHLCHLSALRFEDGRDAGAPSLTSDWLRYGLVMSPENCDSSKLRNQSQISFRFIERLMHDAVHSVPVPEDEDEKTFFREADKSHGFAVFRKLSKHIGMVIPRRGSGERMVLTEAILRTLVLTIVRPESELTYDTFKKEVAAHFGLHFDRDGIRRTMAEIGFPCDDPGHDVDAWVLDLLDKAGMLVPLSDSCSLVRNPVAAATAGAAS